jgi:iron complex outermembrane receptor protein
LANGRNVPQSFRPETTYDFEVGSKFNGTIADKPAALNVAHFDQHIKNVIRAIYFNDSANSGNVGAAEVKGVEADGSARPAHWLQLGFSTAYTDAQYTRPNASIGGQSFTFGPYGDVPKWSGSLWARASMILQDDSELAARIEYYGQTKFFYSNASATILPNTEIPSYGLANLRLEWNNISGSDFSASAFVTNLTDTHYYTGGFALGAVTAINSVLEGPPRMFGVQTAYTF